MSGVQPIAAVICHRSRRRFSAKRRSVYGRPLLAFVRRRRNLFTSGDALARLQTHPLRNVCRSADNRVHACGECKNMNLRPALQPGRVAFFVAFYVFFTAVTGIFSPAHAQSSSEPSPGADPPDPRPDLVLPKSGEWPFVKWSYAKAYTYNFFGARRGVQHRVFKDGKWNKHIRSVQLISREQVKTVMELVNATKGSYETSKCPFPRHAVSVLQSRG